MGLPLLFRVPDAPEDWRAWSFNHAANHNDWIPAVQRLKNLQITQFLLDPVDVSNLGMWLYSHQEAHNQANSALGSQGFDLLSYDLNNPDDLQEFIELNATEHQRISGTLGIG